jgi:hypothetical protein
LIDIEEIQADRCVADADLASARRANVHIFPFHFVGAACFVNANSFGHVNLICEVEKSRARLL